VPARRQRPIGEPRIAKAAGSLRGWTRAYRRWLTTVRFDHPAQQIVLQDYIHPVEDAEARLERLERQITELLPA
jgi:transposase